MDSKFCGIPWCSTCLIKQRAFANKPGERHDICYNCSHKFFVLELYREYAPKVEQKNKAIAELHAEYETKRKSYETLREHHHGQKQDVIVLPHSLVIAQSKAQRDEADRRRPRAKGGGPHEAENQDGGRERRPYTGDHPAPEQGAGGQ